ncbi:hypothetical protein C8R46DRAFT_1188450 [Mycena filopes]|nr:hypothetical protein C8R46DRAFT_1188450 [Mycena filopes]
MPEDDRETPAIARAKWRESRRGNRSEMNEGCSVLSRCNTGTRDFDIFASAGSRNLPRYKGHILLRLSKGLFSSLSFSSTTMLLTTLVLSSLSFVSATHNSRSLAALQHHQPRGLLDGIDICIAIPDLVIDILAPLLGLQAEACVCLQGLNLFLEANVDAQVAQSVNATVHALAPNGGKCGPLPPHAQRECTGKNPCAFTCIDGFTLHGNECRCDAPNTVCSGKCGPKVAGCIEPSKVARSLKSRSGPITTLKDAQHVCGSRTVCGVADSKGKYDFDCVQDVDKNFDSCGGCVVAHPFAGRKSVSGTDCGRILNTEQVSCQSSKCVVQKCRKGFTLSANKDACAQKGRGVSRRTPIVDISLGGSPTVDDLSAAAAPANTTAVVDPSMMPLVTGVVAASSALANAPTCGSANTTSLLSALHVNLNVIISLDNPLTLVVKLDIAISSAQACEDAVKKDNCPDLLKLITDLLAKLLALKAACPSGVPPTVPGVCPAANGGTICLLPSLTPIGPVIICGLDNLIPGISDTVQGLVSGLGLGLAPAPPVTATTCPAALPAGSMDANLTTPATNTTATPPTTGDPAANASAPAAPADTSSVTVLLNAILNITVEITAAAPNTPSSCPNPDILGGLVNNVVNALGLGPLVSSLGINLRRDILGGLGGLGGTASGLTGGLGGLTSGLGGLTDTVGGLTGGLGNVVGGLLAAVNDILGGLLGTLKELLGQLPKMDDGCGCVGDAIAGMVKDVSSLPASPVAKRALRTHRGHGTAARSDSSAPEVAPILPKARLEKGV